MPEEKKIKTVDVDVLKRFTKILSAEGINYVDQLADLSFKDFLNKFGTNTQRLDAICIAVNRYFPKAKAFMMADIIKVFDDIFFLYCQPVGPEKHIDEDDTYTKEQLKKIRTHAFKHVKDNIDEEKVLKLLPYFTNFAHEYGLLRKYLPKEVRPYFGLLCVAFRHKAYEKEGIKDRYEFEIQYKIKVDEQYARGIIDRQTLVRIYEDMGFIEK